ncbi:hypothetical protein BDAP_002461 [Binucleata daphniae]
MIFTIVYACFTKTKEKPIINEHSKLVTNNKKHYEQEFYLQTCVENKSEKDKEKSDYFIVEYLKSVTEKAKHNLNKNEFVCFEDFHYINCHEIYAKHLAQRLICPEYSRYNGYNDVLIQSKRQDLKNCVDRLNEAKNCDVNI